MLILILPFTLQMILRMHDVHVALMESDEHGEVKMNIDTLFDKDMFTRKILYAWLL